MTGDAHDLAHRRVRGGTSEEYHFACVVPLGHDAEELFVLHDDERTDMVLRHQADGIEHRRLGSIARSARGFFSSKCRTVSMESPYGARSLERVGNVLHQALVLGLCVRSVALQHPPVTADEEFLEIPADVPRKAVLRCGKKSCKAGDAAAR